MVPKRRSGREEAYFHLMCQQFDGTWVSTEEEEIDGTIKATEKFPEYVDPMDLGYYYGLPPGNPTLLARNSDIERMPTTFLDETGVYRIQKKRAYEVGGDLGDRMEEENMAERFLQIGRDLIRHDCVMVRSIVSASKTNPQ
jgi:hypothetical protein